MNTSNFINLIGRLGGDPQTKTLDSGTVVTEFSLATKDIYRDRDGNRQERTDWHRVKAFGKLAELFDQYLDRGQQVSIVGSMRYRKWVDTHDQTRTSAEVIANNFSFISGQNRQSDNQGYDNNNSMVADPIPTEISTRTEARRAKGVVNQYRSSATTFGDRT